MKQISNEPLDDGLGASVTTNAPESISWHPAFVEALRQELIAYQDILEFHSEYQLYAEPLRIDCLVIKKAKDIVIKKNIAANFRTWNILEYKSPGDHISIADFYKVYGYTCLYAAFKRVPINEMTISFVKSGHPRKLLTYLQENRQYTIAKTTEGIYTVQGDIIPIQIIDSRKLPAAENLWLKSLSDSLHAIEFEQLSAEVIRQNNAHRLGAYLDVIARANAIAIQEVIEMNRTLTIEQVFQNVGWIDKWRAEGRVEGRAEGEARGKLEIARKMKGAGKPTAEIRQFTDLTPEEIARL